MNRKRIRGVSLLCCHCVRNVAYYRAGWKNNNFISDDDFWKNTNSNFLDIAVLEWCKVFADRNGKHHWRRIVPKPDKFLPSLYTGIAISENEFKQQLLVVKTYRDKFVAHLDDERKMNIPQLQIVIDSTIFLYSQIRNEYQHVLSDAPNDLLSFYEQRYSDGQIAYNEST